MQRTRPATSACAKNAGSIYLFRLCPATRRCEAGRSIQRAGSRLCSWKIPPSAASTGSVQTIARTKTEIAAENTDNAVLLLNTSNDKMLVEQKKTKASSARPARRFSSSNASPLSYRPASIRLAALRRFRCRGNISRSPHQPDRRPLPCTPDVWFGVNFGARRRRYT